MHEDLSKEELEKRMREKVQQQLAEDGVGKVIVHNLENFAYRYLETSAQRNIKCQMNEDHFWVESVEPDILEALKWQNGEVKQKLIDLCKRFPGPESKKIQIKLKLESFLKSRNEIINTAIINWDFPNFSDKDCQLEKRNNYSFEDAIELRNKHAAWLEELTDLFL